MVKPDAFHFVSGENELSDYHKKVEGAEPFHNLFCKHCGIKCIGKGSIPQLGGAIITINLGALDDLEPEEWAAAPVQYGDGRNNDWMHEPKFKGHM